MTAPREAGPPLPALATAAPALLVRLGAAPLQRAEVYFLDAARAMVERGEWLLPTFRGQPFFDKPPLAYWQFAGTFAAFGPELLAARLLSVAWAAVAVLVTWRLGLLLFDGRVASAAALVLATTPGFLAMSGGLGLSASLEAPRRPEKRKFSARGLANIRAAAKARWARVRARKASPAVWKPKRKMSAVAKARLSALAKARWAQAKKAGRSRL